MQPKVPKASPNITFQSNNLARPLGSEKKEENNKEIQAQRPHVPPIRIDKLHLNLKAAMGYVDSNRPEHEQLGIPQIRLFSNRLRRELDKTRRQLSQEENEAVDLLLTAGNEVIDPARSNTAPTKPNKRSGDLSDQIAHIAQCMKMEVVNSGPPEAEQQRRFGCMDFLGTVLRNEFENDYGRMACNVIVPGARTLVFVALWTYMRDAIAFELAKANELSGDQAALSIPAITAIALGPALNIIGAISSIAQGTANRYSIISRLALFTFNVAALAGCYLVISPPTVATNVVGNSLWAFIFYNLARDSLNLLLPIRDNLRSLPVPAVGLSAVIYSMFQCAFGVPMSLLAPRSGTGALPRAVGNATIPREAVLHAKFDAGQSGTHATGNGTLEWMDDWTMPHLAKYFENKNYHLKYASDMQDEAVHKEYIEELTVFAKELLEKPAGERQKLIDKLNYSLYERELERLAPLRDELDDEHKRYRAKLQEELLIFTNTINLTQLWATWRDNLEEFDLKVLDHLTNLEWQLGVYKKPRELERLERLDPNLLTEEQVQNLADLRAEVKQELSELKMLEKMARKNELDDDIRKKRLESLQYQFNDVDELKPAKLRPIAALMSSNKAIKIPDFSQFDKEIDRVCKRRVPSFKKQQRKRVQEEIFVHRFLTLHLPLQIFTPLEEKVMKSIEAKPYILPSQTIKDMVLEVENKRREDTAPLRLRLGVFSFAEGWVETIGRKLLLTNAARQEIFSSVIPALIALSFMIPKDSDDTTQAAVANGIVALVVLVCYMPLILMHMEGASPGRPVRRPGAEGLLPLRESQEAVDSVVTPRGDRPTRGDTPRTDMRGFSNASESTEAELDPLELGKAEAGDDYAPSDVSDAEDDDSDASEPEVDPYEPYRATVDAPDTWEPTAVARPDNKKLERQDTIVVELNKLFEQ